MWVRRLGVMSVIMTVLLMTLGAWVKANDAGGSCPDWPACYGKWLPPFPSHENGQSYLGQPIAYSQAQILYEWTHRAVVSLTFIPVLAFAIVAGRTREFARPLRLLPVVALGLYMFQAFLGALTVVLRPANPPWATTWHLFNALLLLVTLVVAACYAFLVKPRPIIVRRQFHFTPSVHSASRGFTYPSQTPDEPAVPAGRFPGEAHESEDSHAE